MMRLPDWEARLHAYLASLEGAAFEWGSLDCVLHAAYAILALTGVDPAAAERGKYRTAVGSKRVLRRLGFANVRDLADTVLAVTPVGMARRGDIVLVGDMLGVCIGADAVFVGEADGEPALVRHPRSAWLTAWAVG